MIKYAKFTNMLWNLYQYFTLGRIGVDTIVAFSINTCCWDNECLIFIYIPSIYIIFKILFNTMIDKDGKEECSFVDWDGVWWLKTDVVWFFLGDEEEEEEGERLTV